MQPRALNVLSACPRSLPGRNAATRPSRSSTSIVLIDAARRIDDVARRCISNDSIVFTQAAPSTIARIAMRVFTPLRTCS